MLENLYIKIKVNLSLCGSWLRMGEWRYRSTHSSPWY